MAYLLMFVCSFLTLFLLWKVPIWQLKGKADSLSVKELLEVENELRKTIAQIIGGVLVLAGLAFSWEQVVDSRNNLELSQQRFTVESYSKAVDQLGSTSSHVRMGGIFALQKISEGAEAYKLVVNQVLGAFIREHTADSIMNVEEIQATIDVIVKRPGYAPSEVDSSNGINFNLLNLGLLDFDNADLSKASMIDTKLRKSSFVNANLSNAICVGAAFELANLTNAELTNADFADAMCQRANFRNATLVGVNFSRCDLREVDFTGAIIDGAKFDDADISNAIFDGVDLSKVQSISREQLSGIKHH
ncbi:pentapeptide repeat-containing protein [Dyadobacter sp. CY261]|uniref:pentapeptide repeat-containing protein n=1 Tax=Dyadobacter sp. CY261 TaxID=2907203 RepID=UPI001F26642E|nr:pentapeptide repeat-containing protein [Dyadobacter sp. CY261]MCF0073056.1 pentapeptide repeat-containing protein [Dyadobacter sp. CY261]